MKRTILLLNLALAVTAAQAQTAVQAWVQRYNTGNAYSLPRAMVLDSSNNVIVSGYSGGSPPNYDYATIKYSNAGVPLWTNLYNGPGNHIDQAYAVAVDGSNNVVVTGNSKGSGTGSYDYATIAYSSAGVPLWTNRYNGPGNDFDQAYAVAVDGSNNVIVTGYSYSSTNLYGSSDYATIKYSSAGVPLWTNRYNGPGNGVDIAFAVAVDSNNNVVVTGASTGNVLDYDTATIKYSSAGVPLWTNRYNGPWNYWDDAIAVVVDGGNDVIVTGKSSSDGTSWSYNYATIKYSVSPPPILLSIQSLNNQLVLSWTNAAFGLQSAPAVTGTFTNVPAATSPYTNPIAGAQQFFRLISN